MQDEEHFRIISNKKTKNHNENSHIELCSKRISHSKSCTVMLGLLNLSPLLQ